ncbi:SDR family oxidoreductase [Streptomyces chumphonensis]|uniref:3-dehydrosphinganine reductase n=1 Tax=Streptomyces chumphonensis TaxID=1214925 RepID=A0A927IDF2_9ACTN|nr:SDR family oxidoreductase [Streptomyces chumphonensis]MBD3932236.1 SDR family oxidoreductase [Streptomyces chumphonensis]
MARDKNWVRPGDHVIVTGGSSGIGLALAGEFAARGAVVSLLARRPTGLARAAESLRAAGATVHTRSVDVTDRDAVTAAVEELQEEAGPCAVLVTSAGQARPGAFLELPDDVFRTMMDVDYFGTLWAVRAVAPGMTHRGRGTVVTIASAAGLIGVYGYTAYGAAKFAVRGLTEALRGELVPHGVRVSCVFPPDVDTPQLAEESQWKPAETAAIAGIVKPLQPSTVARGIMRRLDRGQPVICLDGFSRALARWGGVLAPVLRRYMDGRVRAARRGAGGAAVRTAASAD